MSNWFVYIIEASDGSLYTGITTDVDRRFAEHGNSSRGARYFRGRAPKRIVYTESHSDRGSASSREAEIKKLSRKMKWDLVNGSGG